MSNPFQPATRSAAKARVALCGPSGSGKTYTGLTIACALSDDVAVIDTERGSAETYVGVNGWSFDVVKPNDFSPASLIDLMASAGEAGYGCVLIDSLTHYWSGTGGMLEQVDRHATGNNSITGWKEMRPVERRMIDAITGYPGHVIATLRTKTEFVIEKDDRGKSQVRKVGLKPEQRDGIEYEFGVVGDLSQENVLKITKSRVPALSGQVIASPGPDLAEIIRAWYEQGDDQPNAIELRDVALKSTDLDEIAALGKQAQNLGLAGAAVTSPQGDTAALLDVIRNHYTTVKADAARPEPTQEALTP